MAIPQLVYNFNSVKSASATENNLEATRKGGITALKLKAQTHLANSYMQTLAALQNCLIIQRGTELSLLNTWEV